LKLPLLLAKLVTDEQVLQKIDGCTFHKSPSYCFGQERSHSKPIKPIGPRWWSSGQQNSH